MAYRTKIQDGQIVVPSRLRRLAGLAEGDPLDVTFEQGKLVLVAPVRPARTVAAPRKTQKQQREEFLRTLRASAPESLKRMWADSKCNGTDKISMREINAEIAASRKEERQKRETITAAPRPTYKPTKAELAAIRKGEAAIARGEYVSFPYEH
jgi:AbrB family looped-hinge helix DNA binding protein